jgi:hypothetical protein
MKWWLILLSLLAPVRTWAEPYVIADRLIPERLHILGLSGLSPDGCPSGSVACSNIVISGVIERVGYANGEDLPNFIRVRDSKTGARYSIGIPHQEILNSIGTADVSWIALWLKPNKRVVIIGTIGGSAGVITIDSLYETPFLGK